MSRRINALVICVELPENPQHPREGSGQEVTVRPGGMVECFFQQYSAGLLQLQSWQRATRAGYFAK